MPSAASDTSADPRFTSMKYLPTTEAYERWATVYDTDGNFLQALDTVEMASLLPRFISAIGSSPSLSTHSRGLKFVDLGCGTGRNTELLLDLDTPSPEDGRGVVAEVIALDASPGMLKVAEGRLEGRLQHDGGAIPRRRHPKLILAVFDLLASPELPEAVSADGGADGVVSTLVLEHVPLYAFFAHAARALRPDGVLLLTNMHADMGALSQAGFVDPATAEKIRPISYAHGVRDVVEEARRWGLVLLLESGEGVSGDTRGLDDGIKEVQVTEDMVERLGPRSRKWVGITCWFGGLFRKVE
jgi:SAM-dependent methyltransferase